MLSCYEFGRQLLETGDLDPVYIVLHEAQLSQEEMRRYLVGYWAFYHMGTAAWTTGGDIGYWDRMTRAAGSKEYPRSSERRHFRGETARKSVEYLKSRGLADLFAPLEEGPYTAQQIIESVKEWYGFGEWIAFKVADMLERLGICKVEFDIGTAMYKSPAEAAELLWNTHNPGLDSAREPGGVGAWAVDMILGELEDIKAPPRYERRINVQECETVLCKWKSYLGGHYHVGKDIAEVRHGLLRFARCKLAQRLLQGGKRGRLW